MSFKDQFLATYHMLRGETRGQGMLDKVSDLTVGLLAAIIIVPIALDRLGGVNSENWGPAASSLYTIMTVALPVFGVIGLVYVMIKRR